MQSQFIGLTEAEVAKLRKSDEAVTGIQNHQRLGNPVSFPWLRQTYRRARGIHDQLHFGEAILSSVTQLDQYLHSYGPMTESQWNIFGRSLNPIREKFQLIDYGCGQGLAGLLLYDRFGDEMFSKAKRITLIDPSSVALTRAEAVYRAIAPYCPIYCLNKQFDDVEVHELKPDSEMINFHLFSNVLDIDTFDNIRLLTNLSKTGKHRILCVSHDRDHNGGSRRITEIKEAYDAEIIKKWFTVHRNEISRFNCGKDGKFSAISWDLEMDIDYERSVRHESKNLPVEAAA